MTITARFHGVTDQGRVRKANQDAILVDFPLFIVADGMGGHAAGETASEIIIQTFRTFVGATAVDAQTVVEAIGQANAEILRRAALDPDTAGMGTTAVGLAMTRTAQHDEVLVFNVGDSRAYLLRDGNLRQVTADHSLVAELVRKGEVTEDQARRHPQRNVVTRALGLHQDVEVDVMLVDPRVGDKFLLCSDGLTNEIPFQEIRAVLMTLADPVVAVEELLARAQVAGAHDNVSIVVVEITGLEASLVPEDLDVDTAPGFLPGLTSQR